MYNYYMLAAETEKLRLFIIHLNISCQFVDKPEYQSAYLKVKSFRINACIQIVKAFQILA